MTLYFVNVGLDGIRRPYALSVDLTKEDAVRAARVELLDCLKQLTTLETQGEWLELGKYPPLIRPRRKEGVKG